MRRAGSRSTLRGSGSCKPRTALATVSSERLIAVEYAAARFAQPLLPVRDARSASPSSSTVSASLRASLSVSGAGRMAGAAGGTPGGCAVSGAARDGASGAESSVC